MGCKKCFNAKEFFGGTPALKYCVVCLLYLGLTALGPKMYTGHADLCVSVIVNNPNLNLEYPLKKYPFKTM